MASTDARPVPRKNVAFRFSFALRKNDGTIITSWAGADSEVSKDGGAFADCTNEATEIGSSGCGYIDFTSTEMNADCVIYKVTFTNTDALPIVITFFPEEIADTLLQFDDGIVTGITLQKAMRGVLAAVLAELSGAGTTTITVRDILDTKDLAVLTVDSVGNRSAVTLDLT